VSDGNTSLLSILKTFFDLKNIMTNLDKLQCLVEYSLRDNKLTASARETYKKLVDKFSDDGFEIELPDKLNIGEEQALCLLERQGYIKTQLVYCCLDGFSCRINLCGEKFHSVMKAIMEEFDNMFSMFDFVEYIPSDTFCDISDDELRLDLISPFAIERLGKWLRIGVGAYTERDWEPASQITASLYRHLLKFQQGCQDEDHLAAIMCNAMMLIHIEEMVKRGVLPQELLDMPDYSIPKVHFNNDN
jgi:hypothetical protein